MKIYKEKVVVKEIKRKRLEYKACDLCGTRTTSNDGWTTDLYDIAETTIECKTGTSYGTDGGDTTTFAFDICPKCFTDTLVPFFEKYGATPRKKSYDW